MSRTLTFGGKSFTLPRNKNARIALGVALVGGGVLGFLPILGFWMIPLGLVILGQDIPAVRRWRRKMEVRYGRWRERRRAGGGQLQRGLARRGRGA